MECLGGTPKVITAVENYENLISFKGSEEGEVDVTAK